MAAGLVYDVPVFHAFATQSPDMAWNFFVSHYDNEAQAKRDQKYDAGRGGVLYPRSATIGGCTAHNAMITVYPNDADFDAIADLTGDPSWGAAAMRPYFERLERCTYRQYVRDNAWGHHACGTCAIGPSDDPNAVIDSQFRVRGVAGLRVVDASVFPRIPGYFIVTAVYMISEKAADVILADAAPVPAPANEVLGSAP